MINSITFKNKWRCFNAGDTLSFRPGVNLLVGDQGCGKSSLIEALRAAGGKHKAGKEKDIAENCKVVCGSSASLFFDFEKDNYRIKSQFESNTTFHIASLFRSHGEMVNAILQRIQEARDSVIFFDEPDTALSIQSIIRLEGLLKSLAVEGNNQVIAAVHNPFLIWAFDSVLDLGAREWVHGKAFVEKCCTGRKSNVPTQG